MACASPIKTTILHKEIDLNKHYNSELIIYEQNDSIQYKYLIIAEIELDNNIIWGNLAFDNRIKKHLLDNMNEISADALIYNNEKSNQSFSYFKAIKYLESESDSYKSELIYD